VLAVWVVLAAWVVLAVWVGLAFAEGTVSRVAGRAAIASNTPAQTAE